MDLCRRPREKFQTNFQILLKKYDYDISISSKITKYDDQTSFKTVEYFKTTFKAIECFKTLFPFLIVIILFKK